MKNEAAVITGASSGIGEAAAYKFAQENYDLVLLARHTDRLNNVKSKAQKINPRIQISVVSMDLAEFNQDVFLKALDQVSPATVLVNNAGIYKQNKPDDLNFEIWLDTFQINLLGPVKITQSLWPIFKKQNKGSIVNIASTLAVKPTPGTGAYSSLKAAMVNWTLCLAQEGGSSNIRANVICPGFVETPIHSFYQAMPEVKQKAYENIYRLQLLKKIGQPEHVAETIYFLGSDLSNWTTGAVVNVDGGINIK